MEQRCTRCEHANPADARFCNQCGSALGRQGAPAAYTPRHLSDQILQLRSAIEGERKQVSVLFVDIQDSVNLSRLLEAERWHVIINRFFELVADTIHDYEGTINQYTGDGVMALFGAPLAHEDHARRACLAALNIRRRIRSLAGEIKASDGVELSIRQGLNSGEVVVGKIGDDLRMDYTAKGQTVGLAARMEQLAEADSIRISEYTRDLVEGDFELKARSPVAVKGFDHKIANYELRASGENQQRFALRLEQHSTAAFTGRERELGLLQAYRERVVREGQGLMVAIISETGMGKSRLCHEFARSTREAGLQVVETRGLSHHRAEPLRPLTHFFRSLLGIPGDEAPERLADVVEQQTRRFALSPRLREGLLQLVGGEDADRTMPGDTRQYQDLANQIMHHLATEGVFQEPTVILLENLHWLDDPIHPDYLDGQLALVHEMPVLVVATARPDYALRWRDEPWFRQLQLRPFDAEQSAAFLNQLMGADERLAALKSQIAERAGGSPLFMEEIIRQLVSTGVLEQDGRRFKLKRLPERIAVPPSVQAIVGARIDALPPDDKYLLQVAAVIGRRVPLGLLREVAGEALLEQGIARLIEQEFLFRDVGPESRASLIFAQSLFQSVAYKTLLKEQRGDIHRRIADALASRQTDEAGLILQTAQHYRDAGDRQRAAEWILRGVARCRWSDLGDAMARLEQAWQMFGEETQDETARNLALRLRMRWIYLACRCRRPLDEIEAVIEQGEALRESGVSAENAAMFLLAWGSTRLFGGQCDAALDSYQEAVELADDTGSIEARVATRVGLAFGLFLEGELASAQAVADTGLAMAAGDPEVGASLLGHSPLLALQLAKAFALAWRGQLEDGRTLCLQTERLAGRRNEPELLILARIARCTIAAELGLMDGLETAALSAVEMSRQADNQVFELLAQLHLGRMQRYAKQWAPAITSLEDALRRSQGSGDDALERGWIEAELAQAELASGNGRSARDYASRAVKSAQRCGARLIQIEALLAQLQVGLFSSRPRAFLRRYQGGLKELQTLIEHCQARLREPDALLLQARWFALRDETERSDELLRQAQGLAADMHLPAAGYLSL